MCIRDRSVAILSSSNAKEPYALYPSIILIAFITKKSRNPPIKCPPYCKTNYSRPKDIPPYIQICTHCKTEYPQYNPQPRTKNPYSLQTVFNIHRFQIMMYCMDSPIITKSGYSEGWKTWNVWFQPFYLRRGIIMKFKPVSFILFACLITVGCDQTPLAVSYTHLTLPTICSV